MSTYAPWKWVEKYSHRYASTVRCPRCQQAHAELIFWVFRLPVDRLYTHWSFCPTGSAWEPILAKFDNERCQFG